MWFGKIGPIIGNRKRGNFTKKSLGPQFNNGGLNPTIDPASLFTWVNKPVIHFKGFTL
jgi:hypothetical protein